MRYDFFNEQIYRENIRAIRESWGFLVKALIEENTAAELLLRAGVITGLLGAYRQIPDAQETAKDLITQSHSIFESRQIIGKIAEARTELALCYWRTDQLNEARDCLKEALSLLTRDNELRAKALLRVAVVEHAAARDDKAFKILTKHTPLFLKLNNHTLRGTYHITLGDRLVNLAASLPHSDYIDRARPTMTQKIKVKIQPLRCCPVMWQLCVLGAANQTADVLVQIDT